MKGLLRGTMFADRSASGDGRDGMYVCWEKEKGLLVVSIMMIEIDAEDV